VLEGCGVNLGNPETDVDMISSVFVYGTLKRGQCRGAMWPVQPLSVSVVYTHGTLFDRQDYPAMISGTDCVAGERWDFHPEQIQRVLEVLDSIEGANQSGIPDLYRRVVVMTWELSDNAEHCSDTGASKIAYTYHYSREPSHDGFTRLLAEHAGKDGVRQCVCWPA
jgi:gamma-glutamylcyclotransferase (GGCT)/AIG2-like uncharacterized protein YtfP